LGWYIYAIYPPPPSLRPGFLRFDAVASAKATTHQIIKIPLYKNPTGEIPRFLWKNLWVAGITDGQHNNTAGSNKCPVQE